MHEITRDFLVSIAAFATAFGIIYTIVVTRYRERMSMLEKGLNPNLGTRSLARTLKVGMLSMGVAIGAMIGNYLHKNSFLDGFVAYFSMMSFFGGLALILNFIIERRLKL